MNASIWHNEKMGNPVTKTAKKGSPDFNDPSHPLLLGEFGSTNQKYEGLSDFRVEHIN